MKFDKSSIAHTAWNCKYHIVFAPKYRRQVIYGKVKADIGQIIRKLCEWKGGLVWKSVSGYNEIHMYTSRGSFGSLIFQQINRRNNS